ncbi:peptidase S8/S53 domain-containing protein [Lactarius quietus]|nr:peptidase S8/S53 domain-containing protein [Lactarius quietus]
MRYYRLSLLSVLAAAPLHNLAKPPSPPWHDMLPWSPPPDTTIDIHIALMPQHEHALIDTLYDVSDPKSPDYGAHLSKEQVARLVAPHPETLELIYSWLGHHDVPSSSTSTTHSGSCLKVTGLPISQANELLGASVLHEHVRTVIPTTYFASTRTLWRPLRRRIVGVTADMTPREPLRTLTSSDNEITPDELRSLYRTVYYVPAATDKNVLGESINNGKYNPNNPGTEASVDMQYAQAIAYPTPHIFYSTGDVWLEWFAYMLNEPEVPQTISISYGDLEKALPLEYAKTLCDMFAQLGTLGVSVITPADDGVGKPNCEANDGSGRVQFVPEWPSSCPYVTSVGGTRKQHPEPYQNDAVNTFMRQFGNQYDGLYKGEGDFVNGTSCAVSTVAGVIALLNDYLLSIDSKPLGFLNPWLYGEGRNGIDDITSGSNPGCGTEGFPAIAGWDPVRLGRLASLLTRRVG